MAIWSCAIFSAKRRAASGAVQTASGGPCFRIRKSTVAVTTNEIPDSMRTNLEVSGGAAGAASALREEATCSTSSIGGLYLAKKNDSTVNTFRFLARTRTLGRRPSARCQMPRGNSYADSNSESWARQRNDQKSKISSRGRRLSGQFPQQDERTQHSMIGVMRIAAAGIWQEEDAATRQACLRETQLEAVYVDLAGEQHAEDRDP